MATVNFYLKQPDSKKETLIYVVYFCESFKLKMSSGEKINPKMWNPEAQRAKKSLPGQAEFNDKLDRLEAEIKRLSRLESADRGSLKSDDLKEGILIFLGKSEKTREIGVYEALNEFLETKNGKLSSSYLKSIKTLMNHLVKFEKEKRYKITFERINLIFYEQFTSYLYKSVKQTNNGVGSTISRLKNFLKWSSRMGYNKFHTFREREFRAVESETEIVYLSEEELFRIYELPLQENSKLYKVRESFCFGCFTGLRFSDFTKIKPETVKGDEIIFTVQKTREFINVPLNDYAKEILERNNFELSVISNQKSNDYLKEIAEMAEINEMVKSVRFKGAERIEKLEPKWNLISTHTARRTFVTLSLEKGMRPETVMSITGHKSYKNFKRYIKLTDKVKKTEMQKFWSKNARKAG
jgi:integrase